MPVTLRTVKGIDLTHEELDGNFALFSATTVLTVVVNSGVVTVTGAGTYKIDTDGSATATVHTILGTNNTHRVRFRLVNAARTVRFVHNTSGGNLRMNPPEFTLNSLCDHIEFENVEATFLAERLRLSVPDT